jgi:hypothetical protein
MIHNGLVSLSSLTGDIAVTMYFHCTLDQLILQDWEYSTVLRITLKLMLLQTK